MKKKEENTPLVSCSLNHTITSERRWDSLKSANVGITSEQIGVYLSTVGESVWRQCSHNGATSYLEQQQCTDTFVLIVLGVNFK